jgi:isoaspartyl peptidase/L-asparaginase-like protein (Ntn-hydrolase superfamily)
MRRFVRIKIDYILRLDDVGIDLPPFRADPRTLEEVCRLVTPTSPIVPGTGKVNVCFTKQSIFDVRSVRDKERKQKEQGQRSRTRARASDDEWIGAASVTPTSANEIGAIGAVGEDAAPIATAEGPEAEGVGTIGAARTPSPTR